MEMLVYFIIVITGTAISGSSGYKPCTTPSGIQGSCISLKQCEPLLRILLSSVALRRDDVKNLRKLRCGSDESVQRVCCPTLRQGKTTKKVTAAPRLPDITNHPNYRLLRNDICGEKLDGRIHGGNRTSVLEFPWMALIGYKTKGYRDISFECGGTVINPRYILTAAHCVRGIGQLELSIVRVGDNDFSKEEDCDVDQYGVPIECADQYQDFFIDHVTVHEHYRTTGEGDDIALIRLDRDVDFSRNNAKPICLPIGCAIESPLNKGIVTGWGLTENHTKSTNLLKATLSIIPKEECAEGYKKNGLYVKIRDNQICAGSELGVDSCRGDSGGPLQSPTNSRCFARFVQYGIVSFGHEHCGTEGVPGVYTKVANYVEWILDHIRV